MGALAEIELKRLHRVSEPVAEIIGLPCRLLISDRTDVVSARIDGENIISVFVKLAVLIFPCSWEIEVACLRERYSAVYKQRSLDGCIGCNFLAVMLCNREVGDADGIIGVCGHVYFP